MVDVQEQFSKLAESGSSLVTVVLLWIFGFGGVADGGRGDCTGLSGYCTRYTYRNDTDVTK